MSNFISILCAFLVLMVFVFVHELGHFIAGRLLHFRILEFALGMGPVIYKKEKDGIDYTIRALPIGGMCRFHGEDDGVVDDTCFNAQKLWKRMVVVLAGPVMNIVTAVLLAIATLLCYGDYFAAVTDFTHENSPAQIAGMQPGDLIRRVDDTTIYYYDQTTDAIRQADPAEATVVVERSGKLVELTVKDIYDAAEGRNLLGVYIQPARKSFSFFEAIGYSFRYVWSTILELFTFLGGMFKNGVQEGDVMGPVGTISLIGYAVRLGAETVLRMATLISVNLGIMNILPLPALDGGRLAFMVLEAVRGKPIDPEKEGTVHFVGILLLFGLMILLTYKDIAGMIGGAP